MKSTRETHHLAHDLSRSTVLPGLMLKLRESTRYFCSVCNSFLLWLRKMHNRNALCAILLDLKFLDLGEV